MATRVNGMSYFPGVAKELDKLLNCRLFCKFTKRIDKEELCSFDFQSIS